MYTFYELDLLTQFSSTTSPRKGGQPTVATFTPLGQLESGPLALWATPPRLALIGFGFYLCIHICIYIRIRNTYT